MNDQHSYETGSTRPPKSHGGLIAVLLAAVILLCGITTALGLMNIRLSLALKNSENNHCAAQFSDTTETAAASESPAPGDKSAQPYLGIQGQALSELAQRFYRLPPGFWIQGVSPGGPAAKAGLQQGDILLAINGLAVTDGASIQTILCQLAPGDRVQLVICRGSQRYTASVTLAESHSGGI